MHVLEMVETVNNNHMIEWLIILTNVFVGGPTLLLAILTIKQEHRFMSQVQKQNRQQRKLIRRLLDLLVATPPESKHRA